jgi:hypothetical protein
MIQKRQKKENVPTNSFEHNPVKKHKWLGNLVMMIPIPTTMMINKSSDKSNMTVLCPFNAM